MTALHHRATALVFAVAVTLATLAGVDSLAQSEAAPSLAQSAATAPRG